MSNTPPEPRVENEDQAGSSNGNGESTGEDPGFSRNLFDLERFADGETVIDNL